jgi:transcriptional regulator with XRE-family HTH domain
MPFGNRLKEARLNKGLTQEELASSVGVTKGAIGNYESEVSSPKEPILIKLMEVLGVDANFLFQDLVDVVPPPTLSQDESRLVTAYRKADPKYRDLALELLEEHPAKKGIDQSAG